MTVEGTLVQTLLKGLIQGNRVALSKSITLIESVKREHRVMASQLLDSILDYSTATIYPLSSTSSPITSFSTHESKGIETTPPPSKLSQIAFKSPRPTPRHESAFRIGLSGSPGVGKSSFIEAFGLHLISLGHRVAVLAVDPSSTRSGGSIMGDKTRMPILSNHPNAFIRPSPSAGCLGGVTRTTNEAILLCASAGYDIVLVETVGVGQSEVAVADMTDCFCLLVGPSAGDELQGLKKGIVEQSDLILVNKSDGDHMSACRITQAEYRSALTFATPKPSAPGWQPPVLLVSAKTKTGLPEAWDVMKGFYKQQKQSGALEWNRREQRKAWLWKQVSSELLSRLQSNTNVREELRVLERLVESGSMAYSTAAERLVSLFLRDSSSM